MNNSLPRIALVALALSTAGVTATFAQTTTSTPTTPDTTTAPPADNTGFKHHRHDHEAVLSATEKAQLKKARKEVLASNATLKSQKESLKSQFEALKSANPPATKEQFQALHQQKEALHQQMRAAELAVDPTLAPIFAKLDAAKGQHHHST